MPRLRIGTWARRHRSALVAAALVAALGAAVVYFLARGPAVTAVPVRRADVIATVVTSGRVMPPTEANLGVPFASTVRNVYVREGAHVRAGQVLLEVDDEEARAAVEQGEAAVAQATAQLTQVRSVGAELAAQELRQARVNAEQAQRELDRAEYLFQLGGIPRNQLEAARQARDVASARVSAAETSLASSQPNGAQTRIAAAQLEQAQALLDTARARLERTVVRAPEDGIVTERHVDPGASVQAGEALLRFVSEGYTRLSVEPDEANLARLHVGQRAIASSEAFPDRTFPAVVAWIAPSVDQERGTVEVRLRVPDPPRYLRPDMTVSVEIVVGRAHGALVVPREAVHEITSGAPWVLVVRGGRTVRREVRLGVKGTSTVEVRGGLSEGELVVRGPSSVGPGERVRAERSA